MGSPQGSPLSPLLWNLMTAKLLNIKFPEGTYALAFADDISIVVKGKSRNEIEQKANTITNSIDKWATQMRVEFNAEKSHFITIGKQYNSHPPRIKIGGKRAKNVKEIKILGVIIDTKLSFLPHLEYIKNKVTYLTHQLSKFTGKRKVIHKRNIHKRHRKNDSVCQSSLV